LFTDFDELKNERSILLTSGESYQPDRVVVKNGKTYLIDYKTGEPNPSHEKQVTEYRNLLTQMGYKNIESYLLYIKSGELVGV
jgi:ATP-dependent helicase/nuclease subunit A